LYLSTAKRPVEADSRRSAILKTPQVQARCLFIKEEAKGSSERELRRALKKPKSEGHLSIKEEAIK
jgi:hypothetical protein